MYHLRTGVKGCSKIRRVLAKPRLILDEMCRLYGKFASHLRRIPCKMRLIFPRINGPNELIDEFILHYSLHMLTLKSLHNCMIIDDN